jgi:hypothetical protein
MVITKFPPKFPRIYLSRSIAGDITPPRGLRRGDAGHTRCSQLRTAEGSGQL